VVECWSNGLKPNAPILLYSNTPFRSLASEIFLSSLQSEFFSNRPGRLFMLEEKPEQRVGHRER
jgi:hypothetical protein